MTAKEVYNIMKALGEITGPKESVKVIKEFVEQQLDEKINYQPITINPTWPSTPNIPSPSTPWNPNITWDWTTTTSINTKDMPNVTFANGVVNDVSWTADYSGTNLNDKDPK